MEVKNLIFEYIESVSGGPDNFILSVRFFYTIKGNRSVLYIFCLIVFCCELFLIHDEYGIESNVEFTNSSNS